MELTDEQRALAALSQAYQGKRGEIFDLIDDLLRAGERQVDVARQFGVTQSFVNKRAIVLGVPAYRGEADFDDLVSEMREAVMTELAVGDRFWSQEAGRKRFRRRSGSIASARDILVREGLIGTVAFNSDRSGYRRIK